jgi:hypothetical protein
MHGSLVCACADLAIALPWTGGRLFLGCRRGTNVQLRGFLATWVFGVPPDTPG